ncbi:TonB system transport protein ExbD [Rhodobacter sp. SY28-1]|uniref:TonB system transport protein ExbD n=1 Tax=Rhodobacter sp. SY28-1 TaxID=2562317 RepID=UPI0010BFB14A|nr:TonB system transport protein ExbD [Rhodobacter sp. SY28-1]
MALRLEEDEGELSEINVTPFIDVILVLLIVFMVAAPLSTVDVPVNLPGSSAPAGTRPEEPLWLTVTAERALMLGEAAVAPDDLAAALDARTGGKRDTPVFLRADRTVDYAALMQVLDRLRQAGYLKVALVGLEGAP